MDRHGRERNHNDTRNTGGGRAEADNDWYWRPNNSQTTSPSVSGQRSQAARFYPSTQSTGQAPSTGSGPAYSGYNQPQGASRYSTVESNADYTSQYSQYSQYSQPAYQFNSGNSRGSRRDIESLRSQTQSTPIGGERRRSYRQNNNRISTYGRGHRDSAWRDNQQNGPISEEAAEGDLQFPQSEWENSQAHRDFTEDPAHSFWTWSVTSQRYYHVEDSGDILWAPRELQ